MSIESPKKNKNPDDKINLSFTVNRKPVQTTVAPTLSVADLLQEYLGLSGTKVCCGMGVCKACTVALQRPDSPRQLRVQACITPAVALQGASLTTVEGLGQAPAGPNQPAAAPLHPLQEAFLRHFSFQCGYSTPGFLMGGFLLIDALKANPIAKDQVDRAIEEHVGEHVCRCSGYKRYHSAIKEVILATPGATI